MSRSTSIFVFIIGLVVLVAGWAVNLLLDSFGGLPLIIYGGTAVGFSLHSLTVKR
jgi:hypothetical protein